MKKYFYLDTMPKRDGYMIRITEEVPKITKTAGSYGVLPARLLGISYPQYVRLCRDVYGAKLYGKNDKYIKIVYSVRDKASELVNELNKRMEAAICSKQD